MSKPVFPFIDLKAQQDRIRIRIDEAIARVLGHGQYIMGPEVQELEERLQNFTGAAACISCASGTDALRLVLMAWGIGPGHAVFVPVFTFAASAEAVAAQGAVPFFVDVREDTFNMDPASLAAAVREARDLGLKPAIVMPVDLFGQPADFPALHAIAAAHGMKVLVDAAQSFGAALHGKRAGSLGDAAATSFFPAKPFGAYGDGGAVFTQDEELAGRLRSLRQHGQRGRYEHAAIGLNSRLDTIQAAVLIEKLAILPDEMAARAEVAARYDAALGEAAAVPVLLQGAASAWAQYTVKLEARGAVQEACAEAGIPTAIYYPRTMKQQPAYRHFPVVSGGTPVADALTSRVLSLPMHPYLDRQSQARICETVRRAARETDPVRQLS